MSEHTAENDAGPRCDKCGGPATRYGHAWPAGGSFPVTGCDPCLADLAQHMDVDTAPISPAKTEGDR